MTPACAKACPTESIQFGALDELRERAPRRRGASCTSAGVADARLYGEDPDDGVGGDGAFFLLLDEPEVYGLPPDPVVTTRDLPAMWRHGGPQLARSRRCAVAGASPAFAAAATRPGQERRRRRRGRGSGRGERPMVPAAEFTSYYGRPVLNAPGLEARRTSPATCSSAAWPAGRRCSAAGAQLTGRPELARAPRPARAGAIGAVAWRRWCTTSAGPPGSSTCCGCSSRRRR